MKGANPWISPAIAVVGVALVLAGSVLRPSLPTTMITIGVYALIALPLGLIYGQGGTISLAQGSFAAIGAYTSAILTTRYGIPPVISWIAAMLIPGLCAFAIARPILRLPELSLALVTLSLGTVVAVALQRGGDFTGSFIGISGVPPLPLVGRDPLAAAIALWLLVTVFVALYSYFVRSARGRALNAIRTDRTLAEAMGVTVATDLSALFALSAAVAGLAGWFYVHFIGYIAPDSLNSETSAYILFMVVLGGRRSVLGPILGAAFFTFANDLLPGTESQGLIFGAILVLILMLAPDGILSPQLGRALMSMRDAGPRTTQPKPVRVDECKKVAP